MGDCADKQLTMRLNLCQYNRLLIIIFPIPRTSSSEGALFDRAYRWLFSASRCAVHAQPARIRKKTYENSGCQTIQSCELRRNYSRRDRIRRELPVPRNWMQFVSNGVAKLPLPSAVTRTGSTSVAISELSRNAADSS